MRNQLPGDKTEKPTPRRRQKAREQGQVARSRDLTSAVALLSAAMILAWTAPRFPLAWRLLLGNMLQQSINASFDSAPLLSWSFSTMILFAAPVLSAVFLVAGATALAQGGLVFAPAGLLPNVSRINPVTRLKQLFSLQAFSRVLRSILPGVAILWIAWGIVTRNAETSLHSPWFGIRGLTRSIVAGAFELLWKSGLVLLAWSVFDYLIERQRLASELRMTRQELLDDFKETEGHPAIKARIRKLRRQLIRRRMLEATKRASLVLTNPSEFAIALEYKPSMSAPVVVAKGRNIPAQQIEHIARWHGIPLVENPPLAHALYRAVEVGQYIPPKLYAVVAAIYGAEQRTRSAVPIVEVER